MCVCMCVCARFCAHAFCGLRARLGQGSKKFRDRNWLGAYFGQKHNGLTFIGQAPGAPANLYFNISARSGLSKKELEEECATRGGEWVLEFPRSFGSSKHGTSFRNLQNSG